MTFIGNDIEKATQLLTNNKVIAIPTETVYGLAGNALSTKAVKKIYEIKSRPLTNPLILHIANIDQLELYAQNTPKAALKLAEVFWPGPLTLVLQKTQLVPDIITSGLTNVAIRIPAHPLTLQLLNQIPFPLVAPSANIYGQLSPTNPQHVRKQLFGRLMYILDGGNCTKGIESTIVGFENETPIIYRLGAISTEAIEILLGKKVVIKTEQQKTQLTPGMSQFHYAPLTPLYLTNNIDSLLKTLSATGSGILSFSKPFPGISQHNQQILSTTGNLDEAAIRLYDALYQLDELKLERIIAEYVPSIGIGLAINDRLTRAAKK